MLILIVGLTKLRETIVLIFENKHKKKVHVQLNHVLPFEKYYQKNNS